MEDLWTVAVAVFQLWMFVVVFLITLPAMFGLSLGVTSVYIQVLVRVLEVSCPQRNRARALCSACVQIGNEQQNQSGVRGHLS